jgi:hypothetical protein
MRGRSWFLCLALPVAIALLGSSCLSPTLPLPPPEEPDSIQPSTNGTWIISGTCPPGAIVSVFDEKTGLGGIYEDLNQTGRYAVTLAASNCDNAWVGEQIEGVDSPETPFVIQVSSPSNPADGTICQ